MLPISATLNSYSSLPSSPSYFVRAPFSTNEGLRPLDRDDNLFTWKGLLKLQDFEYSWALTSLPENVVLTITRQDLAQSCRVYFDASETKLDLNNCAMKGKTISEDKIQQAVTMALELGWGSWSTAEIVSFNGESF
mmetsp:Transcript_26308/g.36351  ORF Transcript_26308/g.36351 Transcript_26308/m.36351 type:complete len:136 (-) Transcript_26308:201-608(-)